MKILYDYQIFEQQVTGGISKYHAELYKGVSSRKELSSEIAVLYSNNIYLPQLGYELRTPFSEESRLLFGLRFRGKYTLYQQLKKIGLRYKSSHQLNAEYSRGRLGAGTFDIFHPTYYDDLYEDIEELPPMVLTIHDMIYESHPHYFNNLNTIANKKNLARRASAIIAVSEHTKKEILRYYDFIPENAIHVVHHGVEIPNKVVNDYPKRGYILYVGERWAYKNFYTLLRAMKTIHNTQKDLKLVCVGRVFSKEEIQYIEFLGISNCIENMGWVSDETLIDLYKYARLYVSTSMDEGFGIPLLECMKYSTPMVLSDIPVYREVAADSAKYYSPTNDEELAEAIKEVYNNEVMQNTLIRLGHERIRCFSKSDMIDKTLNVYNTLIS